MRGLKKEGRTKGNGKEAGTRVVIHYVITAVYGGGTFLKPNYHMLLCGR